MSQQNITIPRERIAKFCEKNRIRKLALFGSVLRSDFHADSDVDVLVEFEPNAHPGLRFFDIQRDSSVMLHRRVDLRTSAELSKYIRQRVIDEAEVQYLH